MRNFIYFPFLLLIVLGCQQEQPMSPVMDDFTLENAFDDIGIGKWLSEPVTVNRSDYALEDIFKEVGLSVMEMVNQEEVDLTRVAASGYIISISHDEIMISPIINKFLPSDDDKKCGGKTGDGWKSFGTCFSEDCVEDLMKKAAEELGEPGLGQCFDVRVKRTLTSARVCARISDCEMFLR